MNVLFKCNESFLISTSNDGNLKLWEICDESKQPVSIEKIKKELVLKNKFNLMESDFYVESRQILCSCLKHDKVFYGDDGINLKVLDISEGNVTLVMSVAI